MLSVSALDTPPPGEREGITASGAIQTDTTV
ncbi:MAG: hypothetical protein J07HX64_01616 [halophilic archaeon J07HX64]|nr:MAG: hypothetical protein J07HX64_01616 [halophilic archaeon J07HX64]